MKRNAAFPDPASKAPLRFSIALGALFFALGHGGHASARKAAPREPTPMVVDLHVDVPYQVHFKSRHPALREGHATPATLRAGNYGGIVLPIYMHPVHKDGSHIEDAAGILASIEKIVEKSQAFTKIGAPAAEPGKVSVFLSIEGAGAFSKDVPAIDRFIERGVRLIGPVHSSNNDFASSATGKRVEFGLTDLGKQFCTRIYERGALVDVSHLSDAGFSDLVPIARSFGAPIVATHSNARAVAKHPRNLTDEQLRAIAETGGVAGLNFHSPFVAVGEEATLDDVMLHLNHMVKIAGIDHVAIGSDYDGGIKPARGLEDASALPRLAARMRKSGMSEADVLKVFSLNALRVLGWRPPGWGLPAGAVVAEAGLP
ncbi:MAG: dipeptidase [Polyangiaceae bacterium]|nr:dipeptidase [Polyangiaceae bacterium]NUQ73032.1 dipeptidase [Polyangiaceae bacterium]